MSTEPPTFAALAWNPRDPAARAITQSIEAAVRREAPALVALKAGEGHVVLARASDVRPSPIAGTLIVGDYIPRQPGWAPRSGKLADLVTGGWGRYVAVEATLAGLSVLRDPSGAIPVWVLADQSVVLVASILAPAIIRAAARKVDVDWRRVGHVLAHPTAAAHLSLLTGVDKPAAGTVTRWAAGRLAIEPVWQPLAIAQAARTKPPTEVEAGLRAAVGHAVTGLAADHGRLLLELSGGFDSSVVLGALAAGGLAERTTALNLATRQVAGDESAYARAAAARAGVRLREATLDAAMIDYAALERAGQPPEPLMFGLDLAHNEVLTAEVERAGASAVLTGQGGDAVFFQMATPLVGVDLIRERGWRALFSTGAWAAAHRSRSTLWTITRLALQDRLGGIPPGAFPQTLLTDRLTADLDPMLLRHPWVAGTDGVPPAKAMQLDALANCQLFVGPALGVGASRQVHPLLAQPVVELCLSIPVPQLTDGPLDRGLARRAFAKWLPPEVRSRRGKGEAAGYYNRAVVRNLATLRRLLVGGLLVEHGLLDPDRLDALLDEDALLWRDDYRALVMAASLECWVRDWDARLG